MDNIGQRTTRTTITIPSDLMADAKSLRLNVSRHCQQSLAAEVARLKAERWSKANADAIAEYNADVLADGLLLKDQGTW